MQRLVLVSVVLALLALPALPAVPAAAQPAATCLPSGGEQIVPATPDPGDFRITGGGSGHGAGMSQYGARGAALLGCDAETIVETYYPGAQVGTIRMPGAVRVSLDTDATSRRVSGVEGTIPFELCRDGECTDTGLRLAPDVTWTVGLTIEGGDVRYVVRDGDREIWRGGDRYALLRARLSADDGDRRIIRAGNRYRWGFLEFDSVYDATPTMFVTVEVAPFDRYLYGLAEVPSSWPEEALKAQAIAARSYAVIRRLRHEGARTACRCDLYATTVDQAYSGWEKESEGSRGQFGARWRAAVDATRSPDYSAALAVTVDGQVADAFYSSSHAGYSESTAFVFGGVLPHHQPVDDTRWENAGDNPLRTWSRTVSADELGAAFGVGRALEVTFPGPQGNACRVGDLDLGYGGVTIVGTERTRTVDGNQFRRSMDLRSTLFSVNADAGNGCPTGGPAGRIGAAPGRPSRARHRPRPSRPRHRRPRPSRPRHRRRTSRPRGAGAAARPGAPAPVDRVAGQTRVGTAVAAARRHWDQAEVAVVTTGRDYPDALAAGALAAGLDAPLLLTDPAGLPGEVAAVLTDLGVDRAVVVGGEVAVGPRVLEDLAGLGLAVERVAGPDRFATAAAAARAAGVGADGTVVLARGTDFPDALSAAALGAGPDGPPTLLTERDRLPAPTELALAALGARRVLVVGGRGGRRPGGRTPGGARLHRGAPRGRRPLRDLGGDRRGGAGPAGRRPAPAGRGHGSDYPDALAAGAVAARLDAPLLLVDGRDLAASPAVGCSSPSAAAASTAASSSAGPPRSPIWSATSSPPRCEGNSRCPADVVQGGARARRRCSVSVRDVRVTAGVNSGARRCPCRPVILAARGPRGSRRRRARLCRPPAGGGGDPCWTVGGRPRHRRAAGGRPRRGTVARRRPDRRRRRRPARPGVRPHRRHERPGPRGHGGHLRAHAPERDGGPDLGAVDGAMATVGAHLHAGQLVVLESTTYPGTTEDRLLPYLQDASGLKAGPDFHLAFSPERIDPGNQVYGIRNTPKVVGGVTEECGDRAVAFYGRFIDKVVRTRGTREAEMAKLLENTYRHVNIALVNEMAVFCHDLGIDLWDVIDAAATKPFGFQPFRPGPGVGGHCIPIDPNYLSFRVRQLGYPFRFVELAQEINERMPAYVTSRAQRLLNDQGKAVKDARILLLGVTYKPDISDDRESPARPVARRLKELGAEVRFHDPYVPAWHVDGVHLERRDLTRALPGADLVIVLQAHASYDPDLITRLSPLVLDTSGTLSGPRVERL